MTSFDEQKQEIEADADAARQAIEAERRVLENRIRELTVRAKQIEALAEAEILLARVNATASAREAFFLSSKTAWKFYRSAAGTRDAALTLAAWLRDAAKQYEEAISRQLNPHFAAQCFLNADEEKPFVRRFELTGWGALNTANSGVNAWQTMLNPGAGPSLTAEAVARFELELDKAAAEPVPESERSQREEQFELLMLGEMKPGPGAEHERFRQAQVVVESAAANRARAKDADAQFCKWVASRGE